MSDYMGRRIPRLLWTLAMFAFAAGCSSSETAATGGGGAAGAGAGGPVGAVVGEQAAVDSEGAAAEFSRAFQPVISPFEVFDGFGEAYAHPFLGGFNVPRPQFLDIDGDGDPDLFVQEYTDDVMFLENTGTPEAAAFTFRTDDYRDLDIGEWYRFADPDQDGDFDLFTEQPYSQIRYYANVGTPAEPRFVVKADTLRDVNGDDIFSDRQNIPNVTDIDCDGLPDLFIGRLDGTITRYEAVEAERDEAPVFEFVTERFEGIEIVAQFGQPGQMNQPPMPNIPGGNRMDGGGGPNGGALLFPGRDRSFPPYGESSGFFLAHGGPGSGSSLPHGELATGSLLPHGSTRHGANTMTFADIDLDGDQDLFWGDFFEPSVLRIENTGTCERPVLRSRPRPFPSPDPMVSSGYNAPAFADINGDGRLDFFAGVLGGAFNPNLTVHAPFYFYEQSGEDAFQLRTRRFLHQIDVGSESYPSFTDFDGDGDLDMLVGNKISSESSDTAVLTRFENTGTPAAPQFMLRDSLDLHASYHYAPAFADLDGDGDTEMLLGTWNDGVAFYERSEGGFEPVDLKFVQLTRGSHSTPALVDIDADGDLDLFIGETSGTINFYENAGTPSSPSYELVSDEYLGIDIGRRSAPSFFDVDEDGDYDMIVGTEDSGLLVFRNAGTASDAAFEPAGAMMLRFPGMAVPAFADLDDDGHMDLVVGGLGGGLRYFDGIRR